MAVLLALLALIVIVSAALLLRRSPAAGRLAPAPADGAVVGLPLGPLTGDDVRRVRFPIVLRGYRPADVDALLARLADQLGADSAASPEPIAPVATAGVAPAAAGPGTVAPEVGQP